MDRRNFLKKLGLGATAVAAPTIVSCTSDKSNGALPQEPPVGKMTTRTNPNTGDVVSILGYGMMRLPTVDSQGSAREDDAPIDQEQVNRLVDYAIEHGVNYFDTSPAYCRGNSERATGIALARHDRSKLFIATKLSNFSPDTWSRAASIEMFQNSLKELQTTYIDYLLLHAIGMGADGMGEFNKRYIDNGILNYLVEQKKAGVIRNLGFSYHGDIAVFDHALKMMDDGEIHWDFVQIELNYLDWEWANEISDANTDAKYLYGELEKRHIPAVVMEPLLGGRLSHLPDPLAHRLKQHDPERSVASWAFRYAGTPAGILTVLSGMTLMEHLKDNLLSYCPLIPLTDEEMRMCERVGGDLVSYHTIPCNDCKYCMPCPYGINIPAIFVQHNKCLSEDHVPNDRMDPDYAASRRAYLVGMDRAVPRDRQPDHCIGCGQCSPHCPQRINIPEELRHISEYQEKLRREKPGHHHMPPKENGNNG